MRPLAKSFIEFMNFVTVDSNEYGHMRPQLGLDEGSLPALVVYQPNIGQAFPFHQKRSIIPEAVEKFIHEIAEGKVVPFEGGGKPVHPPEKEVVHDEI